MQGILVAIAFALLVALFESYRLMQQQYNREMKVFLFLLSASVALVVLHFCRVTIPSPLTLIDTVYAPIYEMLFGWMNIR